MGLVYKDLMGKMGIDDEGLFELAYCELDYISNELQKIYKSPYISDLNSYILFAIREFHFPHKKYATIAQRQGQHICRPYQS